MSEHIDDRAERTITGAAGNAVGGELAALTRRMTAQPAGPVPTGAGAHRASEGSEQSVANRGIRESRTTVCARTRRAPPPSPQQTAREAITHGACHTRRLRLFASQDAGAPLPSPKVGHATFVRK
jgi:hypothetical protein